MEPKDDIGTDGEKEGESNRMSDLLSPPSEETNPRSEGAHLSESSFTGEGAHLSSGGISRGIPTPSEATNPSPPTSHTRQV